MTEKGRAGIKRRARAQYLRHRQKRIEQRRAYYKANKELVVKMVTLGRYKLSLADWITLRVKQKDCCAICRKHETECRSGRLVIDHDHQTGRVRGLLCDDCNVGIGRLKDSQTNLIAAAYYLESSGI